MSLQTFFDSFALLADAPNGVDQLRELILQLAVEGKLVAQDSSDEPASRLLLRIKTDKERLAREKRVSKEEVTQPIQHDEAPFAVPDNWLWVRLSQMANEVHYGYTASANHALTEVRLLRITDIQNGKVDWASVPGCEIDQKKLEGVKLANNDILIARTGGTIGKSYIVENLNLLAVFASYLIRAIPNENVFARYLKIFLDSELYWAQLYAKSMGTGQPNVNATSLKSLLVPLPPLEEQKRIVAKVDELMRLCDELEARQQANRQSRARLNNATLAPLNNADSLAPEEFEQAAARLADNFATLYDSAETVGTLRTTILQLAVQGKLNAQDHSDESASSLLRRIKEEKERLTENGMIRKENLLPLIQPRAFGDQLPVNWVKVRLGDVVNCLDFRRKPINKEERLLRGGNIPYYGANGRVGWIDDYLFDEDLVLVVEDETFIGRTLPFSYKIMGKAWVNNHAHVLQPTLGIHVDFLNFSLAHYPFVELTAGTTGRKKLNKSTLLSVAFRLPPLEEQERIVAKVNQLMALCDELETKLRQAEADSEKLMNAAVQHVLASISETATHIPTGAVA